MDIRYNYISLVALGNFNPAIVTPDFLKKECGLDLGKVISESPSIMPIHKDIQFENIRLTFDLTRLEFKETNFQNGRGSNLVNIFRIYYEKLPYTPIKAVGVNFNCEIIVEEADFKRLLDKIRDPKTYLSFLNIDSIEVAEKSVYQKNTKAWLGADFIVKNLKNFKRQISILKKNDTFNINYNFETTNWGQEENGLKNFVQNYEPFCVEFAEFGENLRR
ncbi:MAG: hypothetical protein Q8P24_16640 [Desulfobacterales bacterium]|nr:hypothetical protein [Desulfobacterales bacterium]